MDREAFERVVREHKNRAYSYAVHMLRRPFEAQDVAQEALVRLWKHRERVEDGAARFWLRRTVHNLCIDRIRRREASPEVDGELKETISPDQRADPCRLVESAELGRAIQGALSLLPARDRAVLILREVEGMPYAEIAGVLGVPLGTLKARLHRAREQLRAKLTRAGMTP